MISSPVLDRQDYSKMAYTTGSDTDRDFYGTPQPWIDLCRKVMGGIELDPASCQEANDRVVKADRFFNEEQDALTQSWKCETLFLNPPYSSVLTNRFATKFLEEWQAGKIRQAIILINNSTETKAFGMFDQGSIRHAYPRSRIQFISTEGRSKNQNSRGQTFFYCGPRKKRFENVFFAANCRIVAPIRRAG